MAADHGITWLASYPKSGNTWLRCLLEAVHRNGALDINDLRFCAGDGGGAFIRSVSPIPVKALGIQGELLLRPAALLNLQSATRGDDCFVKTHFCNMQFDDCPPNIPHQFTKKAVYIVRDPRCVLGSFSKYFDFSLRRACEGMADTDFVIGGDLHALQWISSWSNHVSTWTSETKFPVHLIRYEDMVDDTAKELREVLDFLEIEYDDELIVRAVDAADIHRLKKQELEHGFKENRNADERGEFFNGSGTDWRNEVGLQWAQQVENDHAVVMRLLGYLDDQSADLAVVK